jgi:DNA-binding CsgD family transcriptional regulator
MRPRDADRRFAASPTNRAMLVRPGRLCDADTMLKTVVIYALALAAGVFALEWLEYRHLTRAFSTEIYIALLAAGFVGLGLWAGRKLTPRLPQREFRRNDAGIASLGLTARECEILELLASGESIKELARRLDVSPNTVKTHVARVYEKLDVRRRVEAIEKARALSIIA